MKNKIALLLLLAVVIAIGVWQFLLKTTPVETIENEIPVDSTSAADLQVIDRSARQRFPKVKLDRKGHLTEIDHNSELAKNLRRILFKRALIEDETERNPSFYAQTEEKVRNEKKPLIAIMKQAQTDRFGEKHVQDAEVLISSSVNCQVGPGDRKSVELKSLEKEACVSAIEDVGGWQMDQKIEIEYRELDLGKSSVDVQLAWGRLIQDEMSAIVIERYLDKERQKSGG